MKNAFLQKVILLVLFLVCVLTGWCAINMAFTLSIWNILLGIISAFFLFRSLEMVDKINKFGPYNEEENKDSDQEKEPPQEN